MKNARRRPPNDGGANMAFFITEFDRAARLFRRFSPRQRKNKSFDVLVRLRWAMKNALVPAPLFG
jgi:hypothetical protein